METVTTTQDDVSALEVRAATLEDIPGVLEVEGSGYDFPWSEGVFNDCFKDNYIFLVLCHQGHIVGYSVLSDIVGEAHLLNICIYKAHQGKGLGKYLLNAAIKAALSKGCDSILLEVRVSNQTAKLMYESFGFSMIGCRKNYYPAKEGREDALMYQLSLSDFLVDETV